MNPVSFGIANNIPLPSSSNGRYNAETVQAYVQAYKDNIISEVPQPVYEIHPQNLNETGFSSRSSRWNVTSYSPEEITVNGWSLQYVKESGQYRRNFLNFLRELGIEVKFSIPAFGGEATPATPYLEPFLPPRPVDLLPLLETHRISLLQGEDVSGFETLLNWVLDHYIEQAPILFQLLDFQGQSLGIMNLEIAELLKIYGFDLKAPNPLQSKASFAYCAIQPEAIFVRIQDSQGNFCRRSFSWNPSSIEDQKKMVYNSLDFSAKLGEMHRRLQGWIAQWDLNIDQSILGSLASDVIKAETEFLPYCPQDDVYATLFQNTVCTAKQILEMNEVLLESSPLEYKRRERSDAEVFYPLTANQKRRRRVPLQCEEVEIE